MSLGKLRFSTLYRASGFGPLGAYAYIAGSAIPFEWDIPSMLLALSSLVVTMFSCQNRPITHLPLALPVLVFLGATGLSTLVSVDMDRSVRLSAALLPAVLLFLLIADHFRSLEHTRLLYLTFSTVGLGRASAVLWTGWRNGWSAPFGWVSEVGSPLIVVPNDGTFLAVIVPFSLTLLYREPRSAVGILAGLSILLSVGAICVLQSRGAILTLIVCLACAGALVRPGHPDPTPTDRWVAGVSARGKVRSHLKWQNCAVVSGVVYVS